MKALGENGYINGVALILEVNDEQLARIREDREYFKDTSFLAECFNEQGNNAHVYHLYLDYDDNKRLLEGLRKLEADYKSVSWWDKRTLKFHYITKGE